MRVRIGIAVVMAGLLGTVLAAAQAATAQAAARAPLPLNRAASGTMPSRVPAGRYCNTISDTVVGLIPSQHDEGPFDANDTYAAADCRFKQKTKIHQIVAVGGYYNGSGPSDSENVITWSNAAGLPSKVLNTQTVVGAEAAGTFTIPLTPFAVKGRVWFTVQANGSLFSGGLWGWAANSSTHGLADVWQNPGGGWGNCPTWCTIDHFMSGATTLLFAVS